MTRLVRRAFNPVSTRLTNWWNGGGLQVRARSTSGPAARSAGHPQATRMVLSPGSWIVPAGERPGWTWLPGQGAVANLPAMPRWVRVWFRTPFLDRYACEWMWWRGGWSVMVDDGPAPAPPDGGVREPRRPHPTGPGGPTLHAELDQPTS